MKKILAFTLALAMVLSSATMTFAASKEVEALANLKLLLNTTDAEVNADLNRAVGLAMVLKALGYTQEDANAKAEANTFVDMEKYGWAKGFTVLGEELKITNGTSVEPKMFSPSAKLNERAFVAFMLRALGYDVDAAWAKAGEIAKEAGVAETVTENKLTKGEAAVIMYKALMAKVQGDEKGRTLAQKLVDEKKLDKDLAVANGLISGEPEKLTVTAMADNLIEVTVSFDGTVDKETAEKTGNYKVKSSTVQNATVKEDGKTVVLMLKDALANKREFELTVAGVKNVAGVVMDKQTVKFSTNDVTAPTVEKITVTGPKNFEITFSEPMKEAGTVSVKHGKGSSLQVKSKDLKNGNRVVDVELYNSFQEGKEYTVMVGDGKKNTDYPQDYANYTAAYYEEVLTYAKDTTTPEVKVVKADQEKVTLEFTKPVKGLDKKFFSHTFSSYHPLKLEDEKGKALKGSVTKAVLVFYDENDKDNSRALPAGEVKVMVLGKSGNDKIQDNWGNQLADTELVVSISADREAPQVLGVEVKGKNAVEVTFSEEIKEGKDIKKELTVQLLDKDGKVVEKNDTTKMSLSDNKKVLTLTFKNNYVGKTMTLVLKNVKDNSLYSNVMADYTTELEFTDKELVFTDKINAEYHVKQVNSTTKEYYLYVTFEEEMDDSALDVANYRFKNSANKQVTPKGSAYFLDGNRKVVVFELTFNTEDVNADTDVKFLTGTATGTDASASKLIISDRVKDLAGNVNKVFEFPVDITNLGNTFELKGAKAVANNKIEVEFTNEIVDVDFRETVWGFKLDTDNNTNDDFDEDTAEYAVENVEKKSEKVVVLTLSNENNKKILPGNTTLKGYKMAVELKANNFIDVFGRKANAGIQKLVDNIVPAVASVKYEKNASTFVADIYESGKSGNESDKGKALILVSSADGKSATVKVKLTEKVKKTSVSTTTFKLSNDWKISSVTMTDPAADEITLALETKTEADWDGLNELTLTQVSPFRDENDNASNVSSSTVDTFFNNTAAVTVEGEIIVQKAEDKKSATVTINFTKEVNLDSVVAGTTFELQNAANYDLKNNTTGTSKQLVLNVTLKANQLANEAQLNALTLTHAQAFKDAYGNSVAPDVLDNVEYEYK